MAKFSYSGKASKEAAQKATEKGKGGIGRYKMKKQKARLLVLGPVGVEEGEEENSAIFQTSIHDMWAGGRPVARCASPAFNGEDDPIMKKGWGFRDKYGENSNKKKKDFWRKFLPKSQNHVNVIDLDDVEAGPQTYTMPASVASVVLDEINDCESEDEFKSIHHPDEGRILQVKHNGLERLKKEYKAKFLTKTAGLLSSGEHDDDIEEEWADKIFDLKKLQPKADEDAIEKYLELLMKAAAKLGLSLDDDSDEEEEEDDDELDDDDSDDSFDDDDDDDDDDSDSDDDDDDDDSFDDDDDEEEEVKPKKSKSKSKEKSKSKSKDKEKSKKRRRK